MLENVNTYSCGAFIYLFNVYLSPIFFQRMIQMKKIGFDNLDENNFIENKTCKVCNQVKENLVILLLYFYVVIES